MNGIARFFQRSRESGEKGFGVLLDAASFSVGRVATGLKANNYFLRKKYTGRRFGWTRYVSARFAAKMLSINSSEESVSFVDKAAFDRRFQAFLGREWICPEDESEEALAAFLARHPDSIVKPRRGKGGFEIEALRVPEGGLDCAALRERLVREDKIVEERIRQHPDVSAFHPGTVNTIRVTSLMTEDGPALIAPLMRIGCGNGVADNFDSGGVLTMLDLETGAMLSGAMNKQYVWYDAHPETGKRFEGFVVPYWKEALALCREAASLAPNAYYIGWDLAITPEGPVLVEGNTRPSFGWQCVDKRGWRKQVAAAYKSALRVKRARERK